MSKQIVAFPHVHIDAEELVKEVLSGTNSQVIFKGYGSDISQVATVSHVHVEEVEDEDGHANVDMMLVYKIISWSGGTNILDESLKLRLYSTLGDKYWTYKMKELVWDGDYPSTVAVNLDSGEVYFVNIKAQGIDLVHFGLLDKNKLDVLHHETNDVTPFEIKIAPEAMFKYIDGEEGIRHLRENLYVEFDCGLPLKVFASRIEVKEAKTADSEMSL